MKYCTHCGAQTQTDTPPPAPSVAPYAPVTAVSGAASHPSPPAPIAGPASSHTLRNIILAVASVLFIVVALGIGSAVYVGIK
jgi:hypothetical protein